MDKVQDTKGPTAVQDASGDTTKLNSRILSHLNIDSFIFRMIHAVKSVGSKTNMLSWIKCLLRLFLTFMITFPQSHSE